ncbi:MAG: putative DNA binding domain-containing protein [Deltaproteobacteria bacterium]|jgi:ATP-dependent DNA helicase RecG|nr:putative DNA binding domain-containing protein [Deltaproteobacteria bacterium]
MNESQNIEWKQSWHDDYLKWICGFANAKGGTLVIGKDDNGSVVGLKNFQKLMEDIPNKIINYLGIICDVNLKKKSGIQYIEIIVYPYGVPISYHGKYYFRSGSTTQVLQGAPLNEFLLSKAGKTWDDVIEPKATLEDIDKKAIEVFKKNAIRSSRLPQVENEKDTNQIFKNLRLLDDENLKRAAVLLFGKDPRKFFINAFIKIGRFGKSDDELLSQEVVEGNAFELADQTLDILDKKYFKKAISYNSLHRIETPEYPYDAIREVLLNAIVHRQYSGAPIQISIYDDKLMVWNYGALPESITIDDLKHKHASHPRNPILADVFFKGGLIESWGRGTLKVIQECKVAELPEPEFKEMTGGLLVVFFKNRHSVEQLKILRLNERQIKAVEYTKTNGVITNKDYQSLNSIGKTTATIELSKLVELGIFNSPHSKGRGAKYTIK